jgi:bifunctional non-homologous end joining protein LigD
MHRSFVGSPSRSEGLHFLRMTAGIQDDMPGSRERHYTKRRLSLPLRDLGGAKGSDGNQRGSVSTSPVVEIQGRQLKLSNLDKVLYPATGFTKGQVIDYYAHIAPVLVPHLAGRPLTLKRYPNGVDSEFFFEKNATAHRPDWIKTAPIWSEGNRRNVNYILADDLPTVIWMANLAAIELHPSLSLARNIDCPTMMVFDLDPGPPANIVQCAQVAMWLREIFEHFGLRSFPKTSGSKGLQIYVPLNTPTSYEVTKPFAHALARLLEDQHRELVVSDMKKELRKGKVLVDWSQNDEHKTTIAIYSLRAREHPTVSTPVKWEEVEQLLKKKDAGLLVFEADQVLKRVEKMGDLFEPVLRLKQKLPKLDVNVGASAPARAASEARGASTTSATGLEIAAQARSRKKTVKRGNRKVAAGKKTGKI